MAQPSSLPSDRQLLDATRAGSDEAWRELVARHGPAVRAIAADPARTGRSADDALAHLRRELEGEATVGQPTIRAVRPRALAALSGGTLAPVAAGTSSPPPAAADTSDVASPADAMPGHPTSDGSPSQPVAATPVELERIAAAFWSLPDDWQTVLWHRWVDLEPAATVAPHLGRSVTQTRALMSAADAGLFEALLATEPPGSVRPGCRDIVPLLGGSRRGTLSATQERIVEAHLHGQTRHGDPTPCADCGRRLAIASSLAALVPLAVVPGVTALDVPRYRTLVGAGSAAIGVAALTEQRTERVSRATRIGAAAAVVVALLGAAFLIRAPFGDLDQRIADIAGSIPTTAPTGDGQSGDGGSGGESGDVGSGGGSGDVGSGGESGGGGSGGGGSGDGGSGGGLPGGGAGGETAGSATELPERIELLFPGAPQGVIYVPGGPALDLGLTLSTPAPVYAGGTGTIDAVLTNNDVADEATVEFEIRPSGGLAFDRITEGAVSCRPVGEIGASCGLRLDPGETDAFSFRFTVATDVSDRLVVAPSIRSASLEVPIVFVRDLVIGQVGRSEAIVVGNRLGACADGDPECDGGTRRASSATVELPPGVSIESALLVWEGLGRRWGDAVDVGTPGGGAVVSVNAQRDLGGAPTPSGAEALGFASIADVTDLVRAAGGGEYTVALPAGSDGTGVWSLVIVTDQGRQPRRLVVVTRPAVGIDPGAGHTTSVPLDGSNPPPPGSVRPLLLQLRAAGPPGVHAVTVDGAPVGGTDPFGLAGPSPGLAAYDLGIETSPLLIRTTSDEGTVRLSLVAFTVDVTP